MLAHWLRALSALRFKKSGSVELGFMDGPYSVGVNKAVSGQLSLLPRERRNKASVKGTSTVVDEEYLIENVKATIRSAIESCEQMKITSRDLTELREVIEP